MNRKWLLGAPVFAVLLISPHVGAEMSSANFTISASVTDSTGMAKKSANFSLVDAVGQSSPIGYAPSSTYQMKAGFLYGTEFSLPLDDAVTNVIDGLLALLNDPNINLSKQEIKSVSQAIKFLQDALDAFALYEAGDDAALANALNKTKSAINKLLATSADTSVYQEMLAQSAQLAVFSKIQEIASLVGESDPFVVQAYLFFEAGKNEVLAAFYDGAVQSFVKAYNEILLAV